MVVIFLQKISWVSNDLVDCAVLVSAFNLSMTRSKIELSTKRVSNKVNLSRSISFDLLKSQELIVKFEPSNLLTMTFSWVTLAGDLCSVDSV